MKFAKIWFTGAGLWGLVSLIPLFFLYDQVGMKSPPPITHPEYCFGFLVVAFAWQLGFLVIARQPGRYRLVMIPAIVEKFGYAACCAILFLQHRLQPSNMWFGALDFLIGVGFVVSYLTCAENPSTDFWDSRLNTAANHKYSVGYGSFPCERSNVSTTIRPSLGLQKNAKLSFGCYRSFRKASPSSVRNSRICSHRNYP